MINPEVRQLIVNILNRIDDPTRITHMIETRFSRYEEERNDLLRALNVCDYSKDRIQKQVDPDAKMLSIIQSLESLTEKYYLDIEPLIKERNMYIFIRDYIDTLYYPISDVMNGIYIKHSKEKDLMSSLGLNIQELYEIHQEGIEEVYQFLKTNGFNPEGDQ